MRRRLYQLRPGPACWRAAARFEFDASQPAQFRLELVDHQREHPYRLVVRMSDLREDALEGRALARQLTCEEFATALELPLEDTWRRSSSALTSYPCRGRSSRRLRITRSGVVSSARLTRRFVM